MVSNRQLMKTQFNRVLPRDLVSTLEGKVYKFVESFANKNDRQPPAAELRELRALQTAKVRQAQLKTGTSNATFVMGNMGPDLMADGISPLTYGVTDFRLFHPQSARKREKRNQQKI